MRKRFSITDHISGQRKDIVMEADMGNFSRDDMTTPNHVGVEILGPEFEPKQEEPGEASRDSSPSE
jgi:hypothetical protein